MANKKKINVLIVEDSIKTLVNYKFNRLYNQIWELVKKEIKDYFIFNEIKIKDITPNAFQKLENGEFDILIAPTLVDKKYINKISYSSPIYVCRPILINSSLDFKFKDYINFLKFYFSVWLKPFIILTTITLITGITYSIYKKKKITIPFISFSLGNISYINNNYNPFILIMFILVIFTIHFVYAITAAFSVNYLNSYDSLNDSIAGKKILVIESNLDINLIKRNKGIPIILKNKEVIKSGGIENYFFKNKDVADGCFISFLTKKGEDLITSNKMRKSSYYFGSYFGSFALNNKNDFLLSKINYAIHKLKINGDVHDVCIKGDLPSSTIIC